MNSRYTEATLKSSRISHVGRAVSRNLNLKRYMKSNMKSNNEKVKNQSDKTLPVVQDTKPGWPHPRSGTRECFLEQQVYIAGLGVGLNKRRVGVAGYNKT